MPYYKGKIIIEKKNHRQQYRPRFYLKEEDMAGIIPEVLYNELNLCNQKRQGSH